MARRMNQFKKINKYWFTLENDFVPGAVFYCVISKMQ